MTGNNLLLDEYPLLVLPALAKAIGLNEAIVLQQVHYWLKNNERNGKDETHFRDGQWWTFNTYSNWQKTDFPFWSVKTVQRTFDNLRDAGLLLVGRFNRKAYDKTNWYTIDYERLVKMTSGLTGQNDQMDWDKMTKATSQNDQMDWDKMTRPIPETNQRQTTETRTEKAAAGSPSGIVCSIHNVEMQRRGKDGKTWYSHRLADGWCKGTNGDGKPATTPRPSTPCGVILAEGYGCAGKGWDTCEGCGFLDLLEGEQLELLEVSE